MQVKITNDTSFKPISVAITLETKEEFDTFYQVLNYSWHVGETVEGATGGETNRESVHDVLHDIWSVLRGFKETV